jgi:hypothetical protein
MGGACSTHERHGKCIQNCSQKILTEETTGRLGRRWKDNIRMDLKGIGYEGVD